MATAGIVIIGDEILTGKFTEENAAFLIGELRALGVELRRITVIPDDLEDIADGGDRFQIRLLVGTASKRQPRLPRRQSRHAPGQPARFRGKVSREAQGKSPASVKRKDELHFIEGPGMVPVERPGNLDRLAGLEPLSRHGPQKPSRRRRHGRRRPRQEDGREANLCQQPEHGRILFHQKVLFQLM